MHTHTDRHAHIYPFHLELFRPCQPLFSTSLFGFCVWFPKMLCDPSWAVPLFKQSPGRLIEKLLGGSDWSLVRIMWDSMMQDCLEVCFSLGRGMVSFPTERHVSACSWDWTGDTLSITKTVSCLFFSVSGKGCHLFSAKIVGDKVLTAPEISTSDPSSSVYLGTLPHKSSEETRAIVVFKVTEQWNDIFIHRI